MKLDFEKIEFQKRGISLISLGKGGKMLIFFCIKRTFAHFGQKTEVSDLNGLYFSIKSSKLYVYLLIYTHEIYSIIFIIIIFLIKINIRLISIIP